MSSKLVVFLFKIDRKKFRNVLYRALPKVSSSNIDIDPYIVVKIWEYENFLCHGLPKINVENHDILMFLKFLFSLSEF